MVFSYRGTQPVMGVLVPILVFGGVAAIGFKFYYDERRGLPTFGTEPYSDSFKNDDRRLLTTRLRTGLAVCFTALVLIVAIRDALHPGRAHESLAPFSFMLRGSALVTLRVAFWGYVGWVAFCFIRGTHGRERIVMIGWAVALILARLESIWPGWILQMRYAAVLALLIALLAAVSLWIRPLLPVRSANTE